MPRLRAGDRPVREVSDTEGKWVESQLETGVKVRVLTEPSAEFEQRRAAAREAEQLAEQAQQAAQRAKVDAIRKATTVAGLRNALLDYLGIEAVDTRIV